jgi:pyruvate dehydrogenase E2 component (dihydrolipoamide acetyltransferase)
MRYLTIPQLGEQMHEATLIAWHIQPGDAFQAGDIVFEIETEKVAFEVEAPFAGTLSAVLVSAGSIVPANTPVAEVLECTP